MCSLGTLAHGRGCLGPASGEVLVLMHSGTGMSGARKEGPAGSQPNGFSLVAWHHQPTLGLRRRDWSSGSSTGGLGRSGAARSGPQGSFKPEARASMVGVGAIVSRWARGRRELSRTSAGPSESRVLLLAARHAGSRSGLLGAGLGRGPGSCRCRYEHERVKD
jgi:hypothetical protein